MRWHPTVGRGGVQSLNHPIFHVLTTRFRSPRPQFSKIGKVMRHIAALPDAKAPRDGEFKFRERADALVKKWHQIFSQPTLDEDGEQSPPRPIHESFG